MGSTECPIAILENLAHEVREAKYFGCDLVADGVILATARLQKYGFKREIITPPLPEPNQLSFLDRC